MLFVIDFDGTLSVGDTVDAMLERFADDGKILKTNGCRVISAPLTV